MIAEAVESWSLKAGPTVAIVAKHTVILPFPSVQLEVRLQSLQLLLNGLHLRLTLGGDAGVHGYSHLTPPVVFELPQSPLTALDPESNS